jgi:hypothetical protein
MEKTQLEKIVLCLSLEMCEKGGNSNRENSVVYFLKFRKRETTQLEKIVLCLSQEMCEKGDNSIRENSSMFISNRSYSAILATLQITSYALGV